MNTQEPKTEVNKSRSEAQIAASRANGAHSPGPATEQGKARSNPFVVTGESADEFNRLLVPEPAAQDPSVNFSKGPKPENKGRTGGFACLERAREAERIGPCTPCSSTAPPGFRLAPELGTILRTRK